MMGHLCMMELARRLPKLRHFVYASSSSVYGGNKELPFSVDQRVDSPVSLYAATKRADELMTQCYAHLYGLPSTGLRFRSDEHTSELQSLMRNSYAVFCL